LAALTMILEHCGHLPDQHQTHVGLLEHRPRATFHGVAARGEQAFPQCCSISSHTFTNLGAFAVLTGMAGPDGEDTSFVPYSGLAKRQPWVAAAMALFMLSLTGIPATGGFVGKYYLFWATVEADLIWLAALGVLTSLVSAFFYLRVVVAMYFEEPVGDVRFRLYPTLATALILAAVGTIVLGLWPGPLLNLTQDAAWSTVGSTIPF
jgi:NADH-quinone oxidoreductase subunit N